MIFWMLDFPDGKCAWLEVLIKSNKMARKQEQYERGCWAGEGLKRTKTPHKAWQWKRAVGGNNKH